MMHYQPLSLSLSLCSLNKNNVILLYRYYSISLHVFIKISFYTMLNDDDIKKYLKIYRHLSDIYGYLLKIHLKITTVIFKEKTSLSKRSSA